MASVAPRQTLSFSADAGSGNGYHWSVMPNPSGGSIGDMTGVYTAGPIGGVTDVVQLVDGSSNVAGAPVKVTAGVAIAPTALPLPPRGTQQFSASGGSGSGFVYSLAANTSGATIDAASGVYQAGSRGRVSDEVQVTDSLGNTATAAVTVGDAIAISPGVAMVAPRAQQGFGAMGGSGVGYVWSMASHPSGGSIAGDTGLYTAGDKGGVADVVQVTDSLGNVQTAMVTVTNTHLPPEQQNPLNGFSCNCGSAAQVSVVLALAALLRRRRRASG
jgi:hypothetical protein